MTGPRPSMEDILAKVEGTPPRPSMGEVLAAARDPMAKWHKLAKSGALQRLNKSQAESEAIGAGDYAEAASQVPETFAAGVPGAKLGISLARAGLQGRPLKEVQKEVNDETSDVPYASAGARMLGGLAVSPLLPAGGMKAGTILGGVDQALNNDPDATVGGRIARGAGGAAVGGVIGGAAEKAVTALRAAKAPKFTDLMRGLKNQRTAGDEMLYGRAGDQAKAYEADFLGRTNAANAENARLSEIPGRVARRFAQLEQTAAQQAPHMLPGPGQSTVTQREAVEQLASLEDTIRRYAQMGSRGDVARMAAEQERDALRAGLDAMRPTGGASMNTGQKWNSPSPRRTGVVEQAQFDAAMRGGENPRTTWDRTPAQDAVPLTGETSAQKSAREMLERSGSRTPQESLVSQGELPTFPRRVQMRAANDINVRREPVGSYPYPAGPQPNPLQPVDVPTHPLTAILESKTIKPYADMVRATEGYENATQSEIAAEARKLMTAAQKQKMIPTVNRGEYVPASQLQLDALGSAKNRLDAGIAEVAPMSRGANDFHRILSQEMDAAKGANRAGKQILRGDVTAEQVGIAKKDPSEFLASSVPKMKPNDAASAAQSLLGRIQKSGQGSTLKSMGFGGAGKQADINELLRALDAKAGTTATPNLSALSGKGNLRFEDIMRLITSAAAGASPK